MIKCKIRESLRADESDKMNYGLEFYDDKQPERIIVVIEDIFTKKEMVQSLHDRINRGDLHKEHIHDVVVDAVVKATQH